MRLPNSYLRLTNCAKCIWAIVRLSRPLPRLQLRHHLFVIQRMCFFPVCNFHSWPLRILAPGSILPLHSATPSTMHPITSQSSFAFALLGAVSGGVLSQWPTRVRFHTAGSSFLWLWILSSQSILLQILISGSALICFGPKLSHQSQYPLKCCIWVAAFLPCSLFSPSMHHNIIFPNASEALAFGVIIPELALKTIICFTRSNITYSLLTSCVSPKHCVFMYWMCICLLRLWLMLCILIRFCRCTFCALRQSVVPCCLFKCVVSAW